MNKGMNISEYARYRGVSHVAVIKALKAGRISKGADGSIDPAQADADWQENTAARIDNKPTTPPRTGRTARLAASRVAESYRTSRAIRESCKAQIAELEYLRRSGKLIDAGQVRNDAFMAARATRNMLQNIPARLSAQLAGETDDKKIYRLLEDAIDEACQSLAEHLTDTAPLAQ